MKVLQMKTLLAFIFAAMLGIGCSKLPNTQAQKGEVKDKTILVKSIDFGAGFNITETPTGEINIVCDQPCCVEMTRVLVVQTGIPGSASLTQIIMPDTSKSKSFERSDK